MTTPCDPERGRKINERASLGSRLVQLREQLKGAKEGPTRQRLELEESAVAVEYARLRRELGEG